MIIETALIILLVVAIVSIVWKLAAQNKKNTKNKDVISQNRDQVTQRIETLPSNTDVVSIKGSKVVHSAEHRALINKPYSIQCKSEVFSQAELDVINKYGSWLSALASNRIKPETTEQKRFIEECHRFRVLETKEMLNYFSHCSDRGSIQSIWFKYLCRIKFERENPNLTNGKIKIDWGWQGPPLESGDDVFFSK